MSPGGVVGSEGENCSRLKPIELELVIQLELQDCCQKWSSCVCKKERRTKYGYALVVYNTLANGNREISKFYYISKHI